MRKIILFIVLCLFLVGCVEKDLPPEPEMFGGVGKATAALPDWASDPGTKFTTTNPLVFESETANLKAQIKGDEYVYKFGYLYANQEWQIFEFDENVVSGSNWIAGDANVGVEASRSQTPDGQYFAVAYSCSKVSDAWDCNGNKWMLQNFMVKQAECTTGTTKCVGDNSFTDCINGVWTIDVTNCEFGDTCSDGVCSTSTSGGGSGDDESGGSGTTVPTCEDGVKNQDETSVDCGGSCSGCPMGSDCLISNDCLSAYCGQNECKAYFECIDSDGGQKYDVKGSATGVSFDITDFAQYDDVCDGTKLVEYYCLGNDVAQENETCLYGCSDGACDAQPLCTDTDLGTNHEVKGTSCMGADCSTDVCMNAEDLTEYFCSSDYDTGVETYVCSYGCSNGVCNKQPAGLISHWDFDGNALDKIGSNNGVVSGATITTGKLGSAYHFDGSDDKISVPHSSTLNIGFSDRSFEFWVKRDRINIQENILMKIVDSNSAPHYSILFDAGNKLNFLMADANNKKFYTKSSVGVSDTNWHHVLITRSNSGTIIKYYIDGIDAGSNVWNDDHGSYNPDNTGTLLFGEWVTTDLLGTIDEFKIWNYALDVSEVNQLYQTSKTVDLNCQITTADCGSKTCLFSLSSVDDAHVETCQAGNFNYNLCCDVSDVALRNGCSATEVGIISMSSTSDAHAEKYPSANYNSDVCITSGATCHYYTGAQCDTGSCIYSLSSDTDAHVSGCGTNAYSIKMCCE